MNSFDLSLAMPAKTKSEVYASPKYDTKVDPKTGRPVKQDITDGGVTINKTMNPKPMLDGPLGYKYTQLLDTELSIESMAAVVAAAGQSGAGGEEVETPPGTPGFVAMGSTGPIIEDDTDAGYIYITSADQLQMKDMTEISQNFISKRIAAPERPLGIAMITGGSPTPVLESLVSILKPMGVQVTTMESGLLAMIASMKKGE